MLKIIQEGQSRIDLERAAIVLVDGNNQGMNILVQVLGGFGARTLHRCGTAAAAQEAFKQNEIDLMVIDAALPDMDGYDLVTWLRRSGIEPNCAVPIMVLSGHTKISTIKKARDCGASFIIAKPMVPRVLMERLVWVARENRAFVSAKTYTGPDRRFHALGPPADTSGRREGDLPPEVGDATTPNMSQDAIDSLLQPQRANP